MRGVLREVRYVGNVALLYTRDAARCLSFFGTLKKNPFIESSMWWSEVFVCGQATSSGKMIIINVVRERDLF